MKKEIRNSLLLVLAALIWGVAFVAQASGGDEIGPYSFNSIRMILGGVALIPVIKVLDKMNINSRKPKDSKEKKLVLFGGICCGVALFFASTLQQVGIYFGTAAGKAGFLTACYILLVPMFGLFFRKKCGLNVWIGVGLALVGLYLLCINGSFRLEFRDSLILLSAVCFAIQILVVDHFSPLVDGVRMACVQFLTCGILGIVPMLVLDIKIGTAHTSVWLASFFTWHTLIPILYASLLSTDVAYTLQIVAQDGLNPTVASLIMSLESVFSVLAGWLILNQKLSARELGGCLILFVAIILAQIAFPTKRDVSLK